MIDTNIHDRRVLIHATFYFWAPFIDGWMSVYHVPVVLYCTLQVSLDYYRRESAKIIAIFKESLPDGEIGRGSVATGAAPVTLLRPPLPEKASIDEAFIDFTRPVRAELLARYPYLANAPPDAPDGLDTVLPQPPPISWQGRGIVIPVDPPPEDLAAGSAHGTGIEPGTADGDEDVLRTWHDVALSIAAELMDKIRAEVRTQLQYTTSAVGFPCGLILRSKRFEKRAPARACYRGSRGTNSWPKCVGRSNVYIFAPAVYAWRRTAHRIVQEAGLAGRVAPVITCPHETD